MAMIGPTPMEIDAASHAIGRLIVDIQRQIHTDLRAAADDGIGERPTIGLVTCLRVLVEAFPQKEYLVFPKEIDLWRDYYVQWHKVNAKRIRLKTKDKQQLLENIVGEFDRIKALCIGSLPYEPRFGKPVSLAALSPPVDEQEGLTANTDIVSLQDTESGETAYGLRVAGNAQDTIGFLNEHGLEGNGYSWGAIVAAIVARESPDISKTIVVNAEADNVLITGVDRGTLKKIQMLLQKTVSNRKAFGRLCENIRDQ